MIDREIHFYVASTTFTVIVANASDFEDAFARTNTVPADTEFVEVFKSFYTMHCQSWSFGLNMKVLREIGVVTEKSTSAKDPFTDGYNSAPDVCEAISGD